MTHARTREGQVAHLENYETLQGAEGRAANFRPTRHRIQELFSSGAAVQVLLDEMVLPVLDISTNGLGVLASNTNLTLTPGREAEVVLRVRDRITQRLAARIARVEAESGGLRIGLHVPSASISVEQVLQAERSAELAASLADTRMDVPPAVASAMLDIAYLLSHFQRLLDRHEADARAAGPEAVNQLVQHAYEAMAPRFYELERAASLAAKPYLEDRKVVAAIKAYAEAVITPLALAAPMVSHAYHKPLGYAGDYRVMLHCYADAFEGETVYAKAAHRTFLGHPLSAGIVTRKNYVVERFSGHYNAWADDHALASKPYRALSLGCGPARELSDFAATIQRLRTPMELRLIDQEPRALEIAHAHAVQALSALQHEATVSCLNLSFGQIISKPQGLLELGKQDFIYCIGLFDYLHKRIASRLLGGLYAALEPGGELLVGNAAWPTEAFFAPEFVLDWKLLYRSRQDMAALAATLPAEAQSEVVLEPGGAYFFMRVRKP